MQGDARIIVQRSVLFDEDEWEKLAEVAASGGHSKAITAFLDALQVAMEQANVEARRRQGYLTD